MDYPFNKYKVYLCKQKPKYNIMNKKLSILLIGFMSLVGVNSFAHDIEMVNENGVTIYYVWTNNKTELAVSFSGNAYDSDYNEYSGNVVIPKSVIINGNTYSVTSIGESAFCDCSGLTSVTIPGSVKSIGVEAFAGCVSLHSITIPEGVTTIGESAFSQCKGLTAVSIPNTVTSGELTSLTLSENLTSIEEDTFRWCGKLTSVVIPNGVTSIEKGAFCDCSGLTSVTIPGSVKSIGVEAFAGCVSLPSITIPEGVTTIGESAFSQCKGLTAVSIPNTVTSIGENAFAGCNSLTVVEVKNSTPISISSNSFDSNRAYATLIVPEGSKEAYETANYWNEFKNIVSLSDDVIPKCAKPEISFENGKIKFTCETKDVIFISEVKLADDNDYYDAEIQLSQKYKISVYATKAGCLDSDVSTREIILTDNGKAVIVGDVDGNGVVNVADHVKLSDIIFGK